MSQIQAVKEATDIVEIVGERVDLKKTGVNYRGLCPFHSEKTPSFFVSEDLQRYKCFGCGASGDVFNFLEAYEGMTFYEALEYLAERAGIKLEKRVIRSQADQEREQMLEALALAAKYYHWLLTEHQVGQPARDYLKKRGINQSSVKLFQLGYSLNNWDGLIKYLVDKKQLPIDILVKAGLVVRGRYGRYYDRFRDRIMFPLRDHRGRVVGFSGRVLTNKKEAKYINSPETMLYHKRQMLYGYAELKNEIKKTNQVIVVEGELDVIASQQAAVNQVVAIKGSALTVEQGKLLKRLAETIILSLDNDEAGVAATKKAIQTLKPLDLELRVIPLEGGKDPADIVFDDPGHWRQLAKSSISAYEFLIRVSLTKHNPKTVRGKKQIVKDLAPVFTSIESAVEKEYYLKKLARLLDVSLEILEADLNQVMLKKKLQSSAEMEELSQPEVELSRLDNLERWAVMLLTLAPSTLRLSELVTDLNQLREIADVSPWFYHLIDVLLSQQSLDLKQAFKQLSEEDKAKLFDALTDERLIKLASGIDLTKEWQKVKADLRQELMKKKRSEIAKQLEVIAQKATKTKKDQQREAELLMQLARLKI